MGEGYVHNESPDFQKGVDSKGKIQIAFFLTIYFTFLQIAFPYKFWCENKTYKYKLVPYFNNEEILRNAKAIFYVTFVLIVCI